MELLFFGPSHLHKGADLDRRFSYGYLAAHDRRFFQGAWSNDAKTAPAHIVNAASDCSGSGPFGSYVGQRGDRDSKVLGEPCLLASIAFGCGLHEKLYLRDLRL